ncbi:VOC family protein [Altererythrobacter sp. MF3-039]|uniref:VOC family protein n=1 Tax=Altererythrobacter sp. MF3-039 TaxID=3252901 RepID=UPI00390CC707
MQKLGLALVLALGGCMSVPHGEQHANTVESAAAPQKVAPGLSANQDQIPTDVRRTTLIVRDIDNSLKLYRDVLGLRLNYNNPTTMTGIAIPAGGPDDKARFALLSANDPWVGMIGMLQWTDPELPDPGPYPTRMLPGGVVIVMNTDDIEGRCARAAEVPGVTINAEPHLQVFPSRNGSGELHVMGCTLFDPDGNLIEINQIVKR